MVTGQFGFGDQALCCQNAGAGGHSGVRVSRQGPCWAL